MLKSKTTRSSSFTPFLCSPSQGNFPKELRVVVVVSSRPCPTQLLPQSTPIKLLFLALSSDRPGQGQ